MTAAASECDGTMVIRMAPWTFAVALTLLTVAPVGGEDVIPPTLTCVDGLFSRSIPIPGEHLRLRRWLCDVDGQANGECTFGRRCRRCFGCSGIRIRCRVRVVVPVGEQRPEGPLTLACASSSTATPCGPELSCDSANQICVRREHGGPGVFYACEPVPPGCESDRSCGCVRARLCPFDTCGDEGPNSISCVCPRCV